MEEVKRALARTNLTQTALLTLPWTLLQVGASGLLRMRGPDSQGR